MSSTKILAAFNELTKSLTLSKESIGKATKFAMENTNAASDLILVLLRRMKKLPIPKRLPVFYLVDSICQNSHQKGSFPFIDAICAKLSAIIDLVFPLEWPEAEVEEKKKILSSVNKVLTLWDVRQILPSNLVEEAQKLLDANYSTKRKAPTTVQEQLSKMEEFRRENKRQRWEAKLRPQNEDLFAEFGEMWQKASPEEQATPVKNPLSSSLSPMSPFLSPPSPSPFSPLSPSSPYNPHSPNHARRNIQDFEFQKPKLPESKTPNERNRNINDAARQPPQQPQQLPDNLYSPSSPTSSPENPHSATKFIFVWDLESMLLNEPSIRSSSKAEIRLERVYRDINDIMFSNPMVKAFDAEISDHNFKNQSPIAGVPKAVIDHFPELRELGEGKHKMYEILSNNLDKDSETWLDVDDLLDDADYYSDGKSIMAKKVFKHIATRPDAVNVVLTSANLTRALIKLILFNFPINLDCLFCVNYSAGMECFDDLAAKFSPKSRFAVLYDPSTSPEGMDLPKKESFSVITIKKASELDSLLGTISKNVEKVFSK